MKIHRSRVLALGILVSVVSAPAALSLDVDLYTSISASTPSPFATEVDFTVDFGNLGPDAPTGGVFYVDLPKGYPDNDTDFASFESSVGGSFSPIDGVAGVFSSFDCEGYMIRVPRTGQTLDFFDAGKTQHVTYMLPISNLPLRAPVVAVEGYAGIQKYGTGEADDCSDPSIWFGPRVGQSVPAIHTEIELVVDAGGDATDDACEPLNGFTPGHIAWVDRGACSFELKAVNAQQAGASAIIIGNNVEDTNLPPDGVTNLACTDFCGLITIPTVFVSMNDNVAVRAMLQNGTVTGTVGAAETYSLTTFATIYENGAGIELDPSNNDSHFESTFIFKNPPLFSDDFETGDPSGWSVTVN